MDYNQVRSINHNTHPYNINNKKHSMSFKTKKLLLILQLNQSLIFLNNFKSKFKDFQAQSYNIKYDIQFGNYGILFRAARPELLEYLFNVERESIDVAVWTHLDSKMAEIISQKFFTRYFRDLLFILPTNRALYSTSNTEPQDALKIPKELNSIFTKFPGYSVTNTLVLSSTPNGIAGYSRNDILVPEYSPKNNTFIRDPGCLAITKYLKGITFRLKNQTLNDVRLITTAKPIDLMFNRLNNQLSNDTQFH